MPLPPGARLGPYEILAPLGSGGMGDVYRARDTRLGRVVAIKVLPEALSEDRERLARFETEARAASALNHPNIVTIYDVGSGETGAYLAMELVEGKTLRELLAGALAPAKVFAIVAQVADGLAAAHEAGIVHRDLKPENVMVRGDGLVKILDFGLAKSVPVTGAAAGATQAPTQTSLTEPGVVLGSVGYMSPEQAAGGTADLRSDQFSLGAILYEMVTGRRAFQRATAVETLSAILRENPPPIAASHPETPEPLRWVIERCLAKDPGERYASTRDLARDLSRLRERPAETGVSPTARAPKRVAARVVAAAVVLAGILAAGLLLLRSRTRQDAGSGDGASIAILPFQNLGGRKEDEYFSDGMTESLMTGLARVPGLLVIARNSAFQYKDRTADVRDVGKKLGVRYVLEGSVQRAGDSVRVNAQLVDSRTGYHLWADTFDRPLKDIFALQDDISRHIIGSLKLALTPGLVGTPSAPTKSLEAYDAYLRGMHYLHQMDQREHEYAIRMLEQAVNLDPGFAAAHAALARAYVSKFFNLEPDPELKRKAGQEIEKSLALDPNLAEAYVARGDLAWTLANGFPHEEAIRDFRKALEINPNLADARRALGRVYMHVGLLEKATEQWNIALRVDPGDLWVIYRMAGLSLFDGQPERALQELREHPEIENSQDAVLALLWLRRDAEASQVMERILKNPPETEVHATHAVLLARRGDRKGAEEAIAGSIQLGKGLGHFHHAEYDIGTAYATMGEKVEALSWLRRAAADGFPCYPLFRKDPLLDPLRTDPAFKAFLEEMKADWERRRSTL
ncbi:MAG: protein kinase [Thermoanaerobaculia bacterium]